MDQQADKQANKDKQATAIERAVRHALEDLREDLMRTLRNEVQQSITTCWLRGMQPVASSPGEEAKADSSARSRGLDFLHRKPTFDAEPGGSVMFGVVPEPKATRPSAEAMSPRCKTASTDISVDDATSGTEDCESRNEELPNYVSDGDRSPSLNHKSSRGRRKARKSTTNSWASAENALALSSTSAHLTTLHAAMDDQLTSNISKRALSLVMDPRFEVLSTALILANAVYIGLQTDVMARERLAEPPFTYRVADLTFFFIFSLELAIRMCAYGRHFFRVFGWAWNGFDFFLVMTQLVEEILLLVAVGALRTGVSNSLLRIVRILRTIRTVRILHVMKFANDLQMLVSCLLRSTKAFFWALCLIALMLYIVAIYFTHIATMARSEAPDTPDYPELERYFGNLPIAMFALFQGLTGGVDWDLIARPMMENISPWMGCFFFMYTSFAILLVMNVVNATFVEGAIDRALKVREKQKLTQASRLFKILDKDGSGTISLDELEGHMSTPEVQGFFESIDVDVSEARCLFELLDSDGSGNIEFYEFLIGCVRLQGPAKSMDMVLGMHQLNQNMEHIAAHIGASLREVKNNGVSHRMAGMSPTYSSRSAQFGARGLGSLGLGTS